MKKIFKFIKFLLMIILVTALVIFYQWPDEYSHIIFCDVGQGDAILISHGFWQALIDGGSNDKVLECLNKHIPVWDHSLELMVATHADQDHIGGLVNVLKQYQVKNLLISDAKQTASFSEFAGQINDEINDGMNIVKPFLGQKIALLDILNFEILAADELKIDLFTGQNNQITETNLSDAVLADDFNELSSNDRSIVLLLRVGKMKILLMGDLEKKGELAMINKGMITDIDVLKVGHHGAKTSTTRELLTESLPEIGVISCGKNNKFSHPDSSTLDELNNIAADIYRIDLYGELEVVSNGENYWLKQEDYIKRSNTIIESI